MKVFLSESDLEATTVYDADISGDSLVYLTREGMSVAEGTKVDLIASRALRFITAKTHGRAGRSGDPLDSSLIT